MRKILLTLFFVIISCCGVSAAQLEITNMGFGDNSIICSGYLSSVDGKELLTAMVYKIDESGNKNIVYINAYNDAIKSTDGDFSLELALNELVDGVYYVNIGGKNVDNGAVLAVLTYPEKATAVIWGDVNQDGLVTAADASITLQYVLDNGTEMEDVQLKAMDVVGDGNILASNAAMILQKALNSDYKFPVEEGGRYD